MNDISRRGLMRKGALTTAAAVGVGAGANHAGYEPGIGRAQAVAPYIVGAGAAAGLSYLAYDYVKNSGLNLDLGDDRDYGGYSDGSVLHSEIEKGGLEMQSADERVMTSIRNNIANSDNVAYAKGKAAVIEAMNNGKSESEAQTAMQNAIDGYYSTIQANLLTHWNEQNAQLLHFHEQANDHPDLDWTNIFTSTHDVADTYALYESTLTEGNHSLLDGSDQILKHFIIRYGTDNDYAGTLSFLNSEAESHYSGPASTWQYSVSNMQMFAESDGSNVDIIVSSVFQNAWDDLIKHRDAVNADLSGFVTDVYANWAVDEIPTADLVDPITAATQFGQDFGNTDMRSAQAAMLGIPTQDVRALTMEIHKDGDTSTDGTIVQADLFTSHVPTDSTGSEVGFSPGTVYAPSTWSKPAFIAYESQETDSDGVITDSNKDFVELAKPFEVIEATALDGSTVDSFKVEETNNQTAQVSELRNEIDQLNQTLADQREKQEEQATGGGGFLAGSNIGTPGLLAAGGAVLLAAFGLSGGS